MIRESFGIINDNQIIEFEKKLKITLPSDYKEFMKANNGCVINIDKCSVNVSGLGEIHLDIIFSIITDKDDLSVEHWTKQYNELPKGLLAIGYSHEHGKIVLDCSENQILYWDNTREFPCSTDEENVYFIADSFEEFLYMIH